MNFAAQIYWQFKRKNVYRKNCLKYLRFKYNLMQGENQQSILHSIDCSGPLLNHKVQLNVNQHQVHFYTFFLFFLIINVRYLGIKHSISRVLYPVTLYTKQIKIMLQKAKGLQMVESFVFLSTVIESNRQNLPRRS